MYSACLAAQPIGKDHKLATGHGGICTRS